MVTEREIEEMLGFADRTGSEEIMAPVEVLTLALSAIRTSPAGEVGEPYAHEFGRSNGDGTYCVVIEKGPRSYAENFAVTDWPIKPLYASPAPVSVEVTDEMVERALGADLPGCSPNFVAGWLHFSPEWRRTLMRAALAAALSHGEPK